MSVSKWYQTFVLYGLGTQSCLELNHKAWVMDLIIDGWLAFRLLSNIVHIHALCLKHAI